MCWNEEEVAELAEYRTVGICKIQVNQQNWTDQVFARGPTNQKTPMVGSHLCCHHREELRLSLWIGMTLLQCSSEYFSAFLLDNMAKDVQLGGDAVLEGVLQGAEQTGEGTSSGRWVFSPVVSSTVVSNLATTTNVTVCPVVGLYGLYSCVSTVGC